MVPSEFSLLLLWLPALTQSLLFVPLDGRSLWDQEGLIINGTWNMWYDNDYCPNGMKLSYRLPKPLEYVLDNPP